MHAVVSMLGVVLSVVVTLTSLWVVGALAASLLPPGFAGTVVGVVAALLVALLAPLAVDVRMTSALRRTDPFTRSMIYPILCLLNLIVVGVAFGAFPRAARVALEQRGEWAFAGDPAHPGALQRALLLLTPHLPRSAGAAITAPVARPERPAPSSAPLILRAGASAAQQLATNALRSSSTSPAPFPGVAARVFQARAPSVVVIRTRAVPGKDSVLSELHDRLRIEFVDGVGSGFAVQHAGATSETLIVTNHHVIAGAKMVEIALRDGRRFDRVERVAQDPRNDLALLRATGLWLPAVPIASDEPVPGDRAIAIGSPLGLEYTLTDGIVSALRNVEGTEFIQMQTEIAPGSSGGPLLDERGELVGVNTATHGASLNLAVHRGYVRALLEKDRAPVAYQPFQSGAEITAIDYKGVEMSATHRVHARALLSTLGRSLGGCVEWVDPGARISKALPRNVAMLGRDDAVAVGLPPGALKCLRRPLDLVGLELAMLLTGGDGEGAASGKTVGARYALPPKANSNADRASLSVEFHSGDP